MQQKETHTPLNNDEEEILLRYLWRIVQTADTDTIRRAAKSLFTVLTQDKYDSR